MTLRQVSVTRTVPARAEEIFDLLADPRKHALIDGSGTVLKCAADAPVRLAKGARFAMDMRVGLPYKITNTVVEFEEGRLIAWRHFGGHRWRWRLRPLGEDGTEVTETFDWTHARAALLFRLVNVPARNKRAMQRTLDRLVEHFKR
ncbi:MAG: SRPBCC family protein [Kutzneria sp.]|nr:SRPBCC family protein [Kutzneria sp.]MBV9843795.1 SRPBCC family protein [Kutzneria sp.]